MELSGIIQAAKDICSLATCAALLIRPFREWLLGTESLREGQRCLLRSEIVRIYYRHLGINSCGNTNLRTCSSVMTHTKY